METLVIATRSEGIGSGEDAVSRAQAGDVEAFEEIYRENVSRIYALCLRMVRDPHRAEELTQESFIRAWKKMHGFRGESAFSTWLHRLAVNVVLSDARKKSRLRTREIPAEDVFSADPASPAPRPGRRLDLEDAIAQLPEGARAVFVLHDVEGYRHSEIADRLGIATGTAKAQLHRARRMLREILR